MIRTARLTHGSIHVNGLQLHQVAFDGSGLPALLLHGATGNAFAWHDVAVELAPISSPIALDLRGYGDSQWSADGSYSTEDHVSDLDGVISALGADRVDLVGSSWGGLIAMSFAARHPDRIRRLVVVDVEPSFEQEETDLFPRPREYASFEDAMAYERSGNPNAPDRMIEIVAATVNRPGPGGSLIPKHDPFYFERWPFRSDDHRDELASLSMPTLLVHAEDSFVRGPVMEEMAERIPDAEVVHVASSTHVIPIDNPAALAKHVTAFLGG